MNLSNEGFLIYDPTTDMITYKEKSDTYIAARAGKKDYDNILLQSKVQPGSTNAQLNLLNYDMTIFGVEEIALSDSQNVVVFPAQDKIILKKNRTFTFEGSIMAGRFDYYGKLFTFNYETFQIQLNNVDSVRIWVDTPERDPRDPKGGFKQVKVRSVIENLNGTLSVDNPANKSGVWSQPKPNCPTCPSYPNYPIFTSAKPSYVYYDRPSIHKGVYNRDKFYFKLDTFTIDSLDNFTNKSLHFTGTFESAGIFPTIRDTLSLQPDYSLGFVRESPSGGYPLYGGKAKFTNTMYLSNKGLHGDGVIDYITSTARSKDFTFFPDSANGLAESYVIREQNVSGKTQYPDLTGNKVYIHWMPKKDYMLATNRDSAFTAYKGEAKVNGTLTLGPKSLNASGKMDFNNAEMFSKNMVMKHHIVDADTVDFNLKSADLASMAFSTKNFKAHVDFEKREGEFKANGKGSVVQFPVNQYICYMENFKWFMDKSQLELSGNKPKPGTDPKGVALTGPEFISVHPKQDSLRFYAERATFDYQNFIIDAHEVKEIRVADAKVIPDSGNVTIERNAYMRPLENSKIEANVVTNYHHLFNCHTEIFARYSYTASGDYAYVDELKKEQIIHFSKVAPDTSGQTYAEGFIADTSKFALSPAFDFQGKVILAANNQFLVFDGTTGLQHDCAIGKERLRFSGEINPAQIYIPVAPNLVDEKGTPIVAGIVSTLDSVHIYGAMLSPKKARTDVTVVGADGFLFFDKLSREYRISNKEKLVERSLPGNYISFSTKECTIYGEGKMNLGSDLGQVTVLPVGNATHNTVTQTTDFDLVMAINFLMSNKAMDVLIEDINASTSFAGTEAARPTFQHALNEMVGKEKADKLISQLTLYGSYKKFPDELEYTFFFTDVKLSWAQKAKSYVSTGKLGLGSIGKTQINKFVPGTMVVERKKSGDIFSLYLELDNSKWYTFRYSNGIMLVYSSNTKFNDIIKEIKDDDRKIDGGNGKKSYRYNLGSPNERTLILKAKTKAEEGGGDPDDQEPH